MFSCFNNLIQLIFVILFFSFLKGPIFASDPDIAFNPATYPQPMVWVKSLNYSFRGQDPFIVDDWHQAKQARLKNLATMFKPHNVAEARITIWFSKDGAHFEPVTCELPFLFVR